MSLDVPTSAEIERLRAKCRDDTITEEELHGIIARLRAGRSAASASTKPARKAAIPSGEDLIDDL